MILGRFSQRPAPHGQSFPVARKQQSTVPAVPSHTHVRTSSDMASACVARVNHTPLTLRNSRRLNVTSRTRVVRVRAGADDKYANYTAKQAFLFPGQGAQSVGMAAETAESLPAAKELFDRASDILG